MNGHYYMQTGNLIILNSYGRAPDSEEKYKGDHTDLFRSDDMIHWTFVRRFYDNPRTNPEWPDASEDDMCPSFLPLPDRKCGGRLTDTWFQLFIAHNRGAQYYTGKLDGEKFIPEKHGRFSWVDSTCFAPEALIDDKNRQIVRYWLRDNLCDDFEKYGWTGVYSFPRVFWLEDGELRMAPAEELDRLGYNAQTVAPMKVTGKTEIPVKNGESFRLKCRISMSGADRAGFSVRCSGETGEHTDIYYDRTIGKLVFNATESGCDGWRVKEEAPFTLAEGETLDLDVFVDKSVVEVYANERQAIVRRVYPSKPETAVKVYAISDGAVFGETTVSEMAPTNLY